MCLRVSQNNGMRVVFNDYDEDCFAYACRLAFIGYFWLMCMDVYVQVDFIFVRSSKHITSRNID